MKTFTVTENIDLKDFTDAVFPQGSFYFNSLLKKKDIKVNGARVRSNVRLSAGDEVVYYTTPEQENAVTHYTAFENEFVYIADKLSGVSCEGLLSELCGQGNFFAVHRLDRNTEGLVVFAKTQSAQTKLVNIFKRREVTKIYFAVCKDKFSRDSAVLESYLVKDAGNSVVKIFDGAGRGVKIITEYEVLKRNCGLALVKIILHTGKTHQIRAHLAHIGCPVLGDEKYGDRELNEKYSAKRQLLVAKVLEFGAEAKQLGLDGKKIQSRFSPEQNLKVKSVFQSD